MREEMCLANNSGNVFREIPPGQIKLTGERKDEPGRVDNNSRQYRVKEHGNPRQFFVMRLRHPGQMSFHDPNSIQTTECVIHRCRSVPLPEISKPGEMRCPQISGIFTQQKRVVGYRKKNRRIPRIWETT